MRLLLFGILIFSAGCNSCLFLFADECSGTYSENHFTFIYVDSTGNSLLSISNNKYNLNDVKIYAIDSSNVKTYADLYCDNGSTIVSVQLPYTLERSFLEIQGNITDTLDFTFYHRESKCCGTNFGIKTITLNSVLYSRNSPIEIIEN